VARAKTLRVLLTPKIWLGGVIAAGVVPASVLGIRAAQQAWFGHSFGPLMTGFLLGAGLVSVAWALWTLALSIDGSMSWRIGADAEQWTARELHRLGTAWHIEHNVPFPENGYLHDVDHVAIGPYGVLAVETKWTSSSVDLGAKRLANNVQEAVRQSEANAGRLSGLLRRVIDVDVIPLVVFWGRDVVPAPEPVRREGKVRVVAGRQAALWLPRLEAERLDAETVAKLSARVHRWLTEQEQNSIGVVVERRLVTARRLGSFSMTLMAILVALFPATEASADLDRLLATVFRQGGGALGGAILLLPLVLAFAGLAFVYLARRVDPTIPLARGIAPVVFWCAVFSALLLVTP
jgi:hypothetical protein